MRSHRSRPLSATITTIVLTWFCVPDASAGPQYVINISVDGLGAIYLNALVNTNQLPNFKRLQDEGAWTYNARNDYSNTVTVPNHTTVMTARAVAGTEGHNYTDDGTPAAGVTIHTNKGSYVASVFDVAHDNGLSTALFANKSKFILYQRSYDAVNGAPDLTGPDNGQNKIDTYFYAHDSGPLVDAYLSAMTAAPATYSFLHLRDPDDAGHASGWGSTGYNNALKTDDALLGSVLNLVETHPALRGNTTILLTADHGGRGTGHSTASELLNYTIPFCAWGAGVSRGADLYALNAATRLNPGTTRPKYDEPIQPVRNGDIANLSLGLLGLGPVPGSTINTSQYLALSGTAPALPILVAANYFLQQPVNARNWTPGPGNVELGFANTALTPQGGTALAQVYDSSTSPWRLRMQSAAAETTFAPIDLGPYRGVTASIDVMVKNTTFESDDYFRVVLTNGNETVTLAEAQGGVLDALQKSAWLHYSVAVPATWTSAVLKISSSTNSSTDAEAVDFDNIEFYATPTVVKGTWIAPGDGAWSASENWTGGVPQYAGDTATFGPAAASGAVVTLDGNRALGSLTFNNAAGYKLIGVPGDTLTMTNGINGPAWLAVEGSEGSHEIAVPVSLLSDLKISATVGTTLTISGKVTGNRAVTLGGAGTLVLAGSNEYTGATTLNGGTLVATSLADGGLASSIGQSTSNAANLVLNGGTLKYNGGPASTNRQLTLGTAGGTLDASGTGAIRFTASAPVALSGTGTRTLTLAGSNAEGNELAATLGDDTAGNATSLVKSGSGTWIVRGANTHSGGTAVAEGTLRLGHASALGAGGLTVGAPGILDLSGYSPGPLASLNGDAGAQITDLSSGGGVSLLTIDAPTGTSTYGGAILKGPSQDIAVRKSGAGTLVLGGLSTYTGVTTVSGGTLMARVLVDGGQASSIGQSASDPANLVLDGGILGYSGSDATTDRQLTLTTAGGGLDASGTGALKWTSPVPVTFSGAGARTLTLTGNNADGNELAAVLADAAAGNATSLVKSGSGTWILSGANTYTGTTTVAGGKLRLVTTTNSDLPDSAEIVVGDTAAHATAVLDISGVTGEGGFQVQSNQVLKGHGTVSGGATALLAGARLAPGNGSAGTLSTASLAFNADSHFDVVLGDPGTGHASPGASSQANVGGDLALAGAILNLADNQGANGQGSAGPGSYRILSYSGALSGAFAAVNDPGPTLRAKVVYGASPDTAVYVDVFGLASAGVLPPVQLGNVRVGGAFASQALPIQNTAGGGAYSEGLDAEVAATTGPATTNGGPVHNLAAGNTDPSIVVGLANADTSVAGAVSGTVQINFASNGANSGYANTPLASQTFTVEGNVYSGQGVWSTDGPGDWADFGKWTALGGVPGIDGPLSAKDTAAFGSVLTSRPATVRLKDTTPHVAGVALNNAANRYVIDQAGGSGQLHVDNGPAPATVSVAAGSHAIAAPIVLDSDLLVSPASGASLTISGPISGPGRSLTKTGAGLLVLSADNSYSGGTVVANGTLVVGRLDGLPLGGDLTIHAGATVVLESGLNGALRRGAAHADGTSATTAVPEPATAALLLIAATAGSAVRLRRRKASGKTR